MGCSSMSYFMYTFRKNLQTECFSMRSQRPGYASIIPSTAENIGGLHILIYSYHPSFASHLFPTCISFKKSQVEYHGAQPPNLPSCPASAAANSAVRAVEDAELPDFIILLLYRTALVSLFSVRTAEKALRVRNGLDSGV